MNVGGSKLLPFSEAPSSRHVQMIEYKIAALGNWRIISFGAFTLEVSDTYTLYTILDQKVVATLLGRSYT